MDVPDDAQDDPRDEDSAVDRGRTVVVAWVLTVAAAVPVVVVLEASRQVMAGGLDAVYTATYGGYPSPTTSLRQRFEWLFAEVPVPGALLAATVIVLVVAGLGLCGRDPGRGPRRAAAAVGGVAALSGLGYVAAMVLYVVNAPPTTPATIAFVQADPPFLRFGPQAAQVVATIAVSVVAAAALLARPRPVLESPVAPTVTAEPTPPAPVTAEPVTAPTPTAARSAGSEAGAQSEAGAGLPVPGAADYALYRRPPR